MSGAFHGAAIADTPFRPSRLISGFRAGPLGMGHVLITVQDIEGALAFYRDLLGFRISDYSLAPIKAYCTLIHGTTASPSSRRQ